MSKVFAVKIEGKLNTSNKAAAWLRKTLGIDNRLGYGDGGYLAGYVYIHENDMRGSPRWCKIRRWSPDTFLTSWILQENELVLLNTDLDFIGSL